MRAEIIWFGLSPRGNFTLKTTLSGDGQIFGHCLSDSRKFYKNGKPLMSFTTFVSMVSTSDHSKLFLNNLYKFLRLFVYISQLRKSEFEANSQILSKFLLSQITEQCRIWLHTKKQKWSYMKCPMVVQREFQKVILNSKIVNTRVVSQIFKLFW